MPLQLSRGQLDDLVHHRPMRRANKYNARKRHLDGYTFDSDRELARYHELKLLAKAEAVTDFKVHPSFRLHVNGKDVGKYTPDFSYRRDGQLVIEDVKSEPTKTEAYKLRKAVFEAAYRLTVTEIT